MAQWSAITISSHPANIPIVIPRTDATTQIKIGIMRDQRRAMHFGAAQRCPSAGGHHARITAERDADLGEHRGWLVDERNGRSHPT
jgi:hypothetical protein